MGSEGSEGSEEADDCPSPLCSTLTGFVSLRKVPRRSACRGAEHRRRATREAFVQRNRRPPGKARRLLKGSCASRELPTEGVQCKELFTEAFRVRRRVAAAVRGEEATVRWWTSWRHRLE